MDEKYAGKLKSEAMILAAINAGIPAFEIFTGRNGMISAVVGAGTLGYAIYTYNSDASKMTKKDKNILDTLADVVDLTGGAATGVLSGTSFLGNHIYLAGALIGGGVLLYLMSGMIKVSPQTLNLSPPAIPAIAGAAMGLGGSFMLYSDAEEIESSVNPDIAHSVASDITNAVQPSMGNMEAVFTAQGWDTFAHNITHPGDYFTNYGRRVSSSWSNIDSPGSFFNAWSTTAMVVGDMFTTGDSPNNTYQGTVMTDEQSASSNNIMNQILTGRKK
jgi:hypothetical protein